MICIVAHELTPDDGFAWSLAAAGRRTSPVTLLHTQAVGAVLSGLLRRRAEAAGIGYRHIDEETNPFPVPVFPAVEAHRLGLRIAHAAAPIQADEVWFVSHAAHAAAFGGARRCGWLALAGRKSKAAPALRLFLGSVAEFERTRAGRFPAGGRTGAALEFLERRAVGFADEVLCARSELTEWLRQAGWTAAPIEVLPSVERWAPRPEAAGTPLQPSPPRITVVVTYYEKADYLKEALDSLAVQTQRPHEVIVIDDGSPSAAAAAAWKKANDRYWPLGWKFLRQDNAGPAAARNRGAREATGDAVLFCDADNRFRPEMVATLARAMAASGAECVTCAFQAFRDVPSHVFAPLGPCAELGLVENVLGDTNSLFRRDAFLAAGGFQPGLVNEDWRLLLEWARAGRTLETVPAVLFDYRVGETSRSGREAEYASAVAVLQPILAKDAAWERLWPHLAGALRDERAAILEAEAASARAAAQRLEAEGAAAEAARVRAEAEAAAARAEADRARIIDRMRRAHVVLLEEAAARAGEQAAAAGNSAAELQRELAAVTDAAARNQAAAREEIAALRGKIDRMRFSFSWRATGVLRALRRLLVDPFRRKPAPAAVPAEPPPASLPIESHLDAPRLWNDLSGSVVIRGWTFPRSPGRFRAVRARLGSRTYTGTYGLERPDLPLAFPDRPDTAFAGFKIEAQVQAGDADVTLEAETADKTWQVFFHHRLGADEGSARGSYGHWLRAHPEPAGAELDRLRREAAALPPLRISVLMPVYNPDERWLRRALDSVLGQTYSDWELCVADDASPLPHVAPLLDEYARRDNRIRLVHRPENGHISAATNTALAMATGDWVALFDHDDELAPHALQCVAQEIAAHPDAAVIYTDEDKIDEQGVRFDPHFKPDWNPDLLRSQNYFCHLSVYRTALVRRLGGMRVGLEGSQDWDLALRATEQLAPNEIRHVARILYHWRAGEGSTALHLGQKDYVAAASRRALTEHLERTGLRADVKPTVGGHWHVAPLLPADKPHPLVSIIIPTHNAGRLVRLCLASIFARTRYAPFEVILVDNRSDDPESLALFAAVRDADGVRVLRHDGAFNYSALNNFAAREARGDVLCLLNNDIEVLEPKWLDELVGHALRPGVGAVGARLYYPDFRIQHAGVVTGLGGVAGHPFKFFERGDPGTPQFRPHLTQNLSAVTAACLVIRKETYFAVGGFDEKGLPVAFNDVDFCLRVEALGLRNVYAPGAELMHHESASRGREDTPEKIQRFQAEIETIKSRWGVRLLNDPAYNPNLSLDSEDFALAYPPRLPPL